MKLFLLRWNPAISSWKDADFRKALAACRAGCNCRMNWSVRDWQSLAPGDWTLLCRVGTGDGDGIVMAGRFTGVVYEDDSWRHDGSKCHYADADMVFVNDPAISDLLRAAALECAAPGVDWHGGHSGVVLPEKDAEKIALFLAEMLARLDNPCKDGFATARNQGETIMWLTACSLLSDLCPSLKSAVFAGKEKASALDFPRLVENGCELYFDARELESEVPIKDILRPVSWDGVFQMSENSFCCDLVSIGRRRYVKRPPQARVPDSRLFRTPDGREIRLEQGSLFAVGKDEIQGLVIFLPCGLTALRPETESFLRKHGVRMSRNGELALYSAIPDNGQPLRYIACCTNEQQRLYTLRDARCLLQKALAWFEAVGCSIIGMNGFRMKGDSEQRTLDLVRDWFANHPNSSIKKVYLIDKRTGFKSAK